LPGKRRPGIKIKTIGLVVGATYPGGT